MSHDDTCEHDVAWTKPCGQCEREDINSRREEGVCVGVQQLVDVIDRSMIHVFKPTFATVFASYPPQDECVQCHKPERDPVHGETDFTRFYTTLYLPGLTASERISALDAILGRNQNAPPLGEADGSFTEETWTHCRNVVEGQKRILEGLRGLGWAK